MQSATRQRITSAVESLARLLAEASDHEHVSVSELVEVTGLERTCLETIDGDGFCNVEHLELDQDRRPIRHIDVYFGALPGSDDAPSS